MNIPTKIAKYEVYKDGTKLIGRGEEMTLPSFETPTNTVSGAGILGEYEDPTPGLFQRAGTARSLSRYEQEAASLANMLKAHHLEIRGGIQGNTDDGDIEFTPYPRSRSWPHQEMRAGQAQGRKLYGNQRHPFRFGTS